MRSPHKWSQNFHGIFSETGVAGRQVVAIGAAVAEVLLLITVVPDNISLLYLYFREGGWW